MGTRKKKLKHGGARKGAGRKPSGNARTKAITVKCTEEEYRQFTEGARFTNQTLADFIRESAHYAWTLGLVAVLLVLPAVARAYELHTTEDGAPLHWGRDEIVFRIDPLLERKIPGAREAIEAAAESWSRVDGTPRITISEWPAEHASNNDGAAVILLMPAARFQANELAVTTIDWHWGSGEIHTARILINESAALSADGDESSYDMQSVLTHELGHVLGLDESGVPGATMWPTTERGSLDMRSLEADDVAAARATYSAVSVVVPGGCSAASGSGSGWTWVCGLLWIVRRSRQ